MTEKNTPWKDAAKHYEDLASNPDKSVGEILSTYGSDIKTEFNNVKDLSKARQERKEKVSKRLNTLREESGEKQRDVANAIGVNVITLSGYEIGRNEPNLEVLVRLADFYKVSLDYILCRTDTKMEFDPEEYQAKDEERKAMNNKLQQLENELSEIRKAMK